MTNDVLIRNGNHQRPMLAVLRRYGIGESDRYGRGLWINEDDLPDILENMKNDSSFFMHGDDYVVKGTNIHNHIMFRNFTDLFPEEE